MNNASRDQILKRLQAAIKQQPVDTPEVAGLPTESVERL